MFHRTYYSGNSTSTSLRNNSLNQIEHDHDLIALRRNLCHHPPAGVRRGQELSLVSSINWARSSRRTIHRSELQLIKQAPGSTVASARSAGLPLIEQPPRSAGLPPILLVVQSSNDSKRQRHCRTHFDIVSKHIAQSERARSWSDGSAAQPLSSSASERASGTRALSVSVNWARLVAADDPSFRAPTYQTGPGWTPTVTRTVAGARSVEMGSHISNIEQPRTLGLPLVEQTLDVHPQGQSLPSTVDDSALRASQRPGLPLMPYRTGPRLDSRRHQSPQLWRALKAQGSHY